MSNNESQLEIKEQIEINTKPKCGLVMPISSIDGLGSDHWLDVKSILKEVADAEGFQTEIVSASDESGIIQQRIIQNLYSNEIVICDVSGKNPNVMFELGLRLAFDKATIVIKDDKTNYSFDTSPLEHLEYPRDLRFNQIIEFKIALSKKLKATFAKSKEAGYSTFLKSFGTFNVQSLQEKDVSLNDYVVSSLQNLTEEVAILRRRAVSVGLKRPIGAKSIMDDEIESLLVKYYSINNLDMDDPNIDVLSDDLLRNILDKLRRNGLDVTPSMVINMIRFWLENPKG